MLDYVDSQDFQTITQRGLEKRRDRDAPLPLMVVESPESESLATANTLHPMPSPPPPLQQPHSEAFIEGIEPAAGVMTGHQFVKLVGHDLPQRTSGVLVRFGNQECNEVFVVKRNFILCETPAVDEPGSLDVRVSFDGGQSFIPSFASYQFVDPTTSEGRRTLMLEGFRGIPFQVAQAMMMNSPTTTTITATPPPPTNHEIDAPISIFPPEDIYSSWLLG